MVAGIASLVAAYLLGSFLPAYWAGRFLPGIDIREQGNHSAGASNVFEVLGLYPAILTVLYDGLKGVIAMSISNILGASTGFIYLSGLLAMLGHIFPFYLGFRGGKGTVTGIGILLLYLWWLIQNSWLSLTVLLLLGVYALAVYVIFRQGRVLGLLVPPVLLLVILWVSRSIYVDVFSGIILLYLFATGFVSTQKAKSTQSRL